MAEKIRKIPTMYQGNVTRKSGDKTVRVEVTYLQRHPKYGKYLKRRTVALVHDEQNQTNVGDRVEICKCRPLSKKKTWRLVRIVRKSASSQVE